MFFVQRAVHDELLKLVTERAGSIRIGDPLEDSTELGPLAFEDQRDKVAGYVDLGRSEAPGAHRRPTHDGGLGGYFYEPTVLVDVDNSMRVVREEIFGPVAAIMPFDTEEEVVPSPTTPSTASRPGCGPPTVAPTGWLSTGGRHDLGEHLPGDVAHVPAPGFKNSGVGVEHGTETIKEYTRLKSVWINTSEEPVADPFIMRS